MTRGHVPLTPELALRASEHARLAGLEDLAGTFAGLADKFALFNENSPETLEQIRTRIGDEDFFALLSGGGFRA